MNPEKSPVLMSPRVAIPGSICIVGTLAQREKVIQYQSKAESAVYVVRAVIADHIPLIGPISEIVSAKPGCSIRLNENPLTIYLHHGEANAIYFDLRADESPALTYIDVEVESAMPLMALPAGRRAINELLDTLVRTIWLPLVILRLDLLDSAGECIAHEIVTPFDRQLVLGPLGGIHQFPMFSAIESLAREAISAASPYYRFLCAYRMYEGIAPLRKWLRTTATELGVDAKLPKAVLADKQLLEHIGFSAEASVRIKTGDDLQSALTEMRNSVAHFILDGVPEQISVPVHVSDGITYSTVSMAGAALLLHGVRGVEELHQYFRDHLQSHFQIGRLVLPMKERREKFRVVVSPAAVDIALAAGDSSINT